MVSDFVIRAWTSSCRALIAPEACNDARIEKDAGVALNLINKHRKEGYIFVLFRVADRTVFIVEFTIKETRCPRNIDATSVSQCEFLPDGKANLGFCIGRIVKETGAPDVVEVDSCVIYDTQNLSICHHHHHFHHDLGEGRHHCNVTGHGCRHPLHKHHHYYHHHYHPHHHHPHLFSADFVHRVPILSEHDVLQAPDANFLDHPLPDQGRHGSKSCPGKPKYDLFPGLLSLFPTSSAR
ncbi:kininogen-2-like [Notechis scutatus]|uniref:Histidine-rich glycoprotein n=1 Tax=Notechis scutatus TaxID=8663 RepID=A0A6J1V8L7_9SAUR|nr:kininogen-2-like [Notechis scutatus]